MVTAIRFLKNMRYIPYDDYNSRFPTREQMDYWGTLTCEIPRIAFRHGYKLIEEYEDTDA